MALFFHTTVMKDDDAGWGQWLQEHQYEHTQFIQLGQAMPTPVLWPDYDLASWEKSQRFQRFWLNTHNSIHQQLRAQFGLTGLNLADVDLNKEREFYEWLEAHAQEHANLRAAFGITT
jgi:hypothetical protein